MIAQIERVVVSLDPEIVITISTVEEELRLSPPFVGSTLAAATASSIGSFGLLIALIGIFGTVEPHRCPANARSRHPYRHRRASGGWPTSSAAVHGISPSSAEETRPTSW